MTAAQTWLWPSGEEINDFPDPLGFEAEWKPWAGTMSDGPDALAEIFCREYVQNSWDSIQERIARLVSDGHDEPAGYGVTFRFVRLQSDVARAFAERFGLTGHVDRHEGMNEKDRRDNRLDNSDIVGGEFGKIDLLIASEAYGEGMYGPWDTKGQSGVVSRLKSAVMQTSSSKNSDAAGGSWGHGKKAIANASWCRTLAVYSCAEPYEGDLDEHGEPITRRFLGATYWRRHDLGDRAHVGLGLGGFVASGAYADFRPLQNLEADELVRSLQVPGLSVRNPGEPSQSGVSYLIVEPSFLPEDLAGAVLRNWWPLLETAPHAIQIHGYDNRLLDLDLDLGSVPELRPFREAYRLATGAATPRTQGDLVSRLSDGELGAVGVLAITSEAKEGGWSYEMPDDNASLVALVRNDMVIAYEKSPRRNRSKPPFVRGVLLVDRYANAAASARLKMAEPHLHNEWISARSPSVPGYAADFAKKVLDKVHKGVTDLRNQLKTEDVKKHQHFPAFSKLFSAGRSPGARPVDPKPPKQSRSFSIQFEPRLLDASLEDPTMIRMMCTVKVALLPRRAKDVSSVEAVIDLGWKVLEERGPVNDPALRDPSSVTVPSGFTIGADGRIRGHITAEPVVFEWHSRFYADDWQVVPDPQVDEVLVEPAPAEEGAA